MKISLNIIKQYIDFELPPVDELVRRINEQLGGVDEVIDLHAKYAAAKIVKIVECEKHPDADRLSVCRIDDGSGELVQVVCGAPNARAGMWAVWLPPESIVPSTYGTGQEFKLGARKLRGVMSHGMLAAADELAIGDDHDGIIEINPEEWKPGSQEITPGVSFAAIYGLDDTIIDIENKMFTHRPDLFGQLGVARELAGIFGHEFKSPQWYKDAPEFIQAGGLDVQVFNEAPEKVPRIMFAAMQNVRVAPSPMWLQAALVAMGSKPINNIVDITNYTMLLTAQPVHAYDYDKIRGASIGARFGRKGEELTLLNGKTYSLHTDDIVIADSEGAIGLAGIMGGANSEVSAETKNILLEVATFDMYAVRKSAMRHGVFTDALTRFNKGQSSRQNDRIMQYLLTQSAEVSSAVQAGAVIDLYDGHRSNVNQVAVDVDFINSRLGLELDGPQVAELLENVEFIANGSEELELEVPFWRTDIAVGEDVVEEVGRLYGFDKLPHEMPYRSAKPTPHNVSIYANERARQVLSSMGGNEVLTYSFVHEKTLANAGQDKNQAFKLSNALSPSLQYYRLSLAPSLLDKVYMNIRAGYDEFMLYEVGKAHHVAMLDDQGLPKEFGRIAGVYASRAVRTGAAYYMMRRAVDTLMTKIAPRAKVRYTRLEHYDGPTSPAFEQMCLPFEPKRSAIVEIDGKLAGVVGEPKQSVRAGFKAPEYCAMFELFQSAIVGHETTHYTPLSRYQSMSRDVSFVVDTDTQYASIEKAVLTAQQREAIRIDMKLLDIYQQDNAAEKTFTVRFVVTPYHETLQSEEANELVSAVSRAVVDAVDARIG